MAEKILYDIIWDEATNKIGFEEITVLETSIIPGASVPTNKVRHADGRVARCSTDMYHNSREGALAEFLSNLTIGLEQLDIEERRLQENRRRWIAAQAVVKHMLEECAKA